MRARLYQPPKSAMQSGRAGTHHWVLEFESDHPRAADPLMGWIGGGDTQTQVRLRFATVEEARDYAARHGIGLAMELPAAPQVRPKAYADNFRTGRREMWTH